MPQPLRVGRRAGFDERKKKKKKKKTTTLKKKKRKGRRRTPTTVPGAFFGKEKKKKKRGEKRPQIPRGFHSASRYRNPVHNPYRSSSVAKKKGEKGRRHRVGKPSYADEIVKRPSPPHDAVTDGKRE